MAIGNYLKLAAAGGKDKGAPPPPSEARAKLAAALDRKGTLDSKIGLYRARAQELWEKKWRAEDGVETAKAQLEAVSRARNAHVVDPTNPAPTMTARQARDAIEEAEATVAALVEARAHAVAEIAEMEKNVGYAVMAIKDAAPAVLAESKAVRSLCERYLKARQTEADLHYAVAFLFSNNALPEDLKTELGRDAKPDPSAGAIWEAAYAALKTDANAPLPEV